MAYGTNDTIFWFLLSVTIFVSLNTNTVYPHVPQDSKIASPIQEWKNTQDSVKIQFSYIPEKPLVYTEMDLIFSIQDLTTGNHIENLIASITITKEDRTFFKFNDVEIQNGDLSLKVRFVEDGSYQIISQISSKDNIAIALASFNIYVPLQPFGKFNVDSLVSSLIPAALIVAGLSSIVIVLILIIRKRGKGEKLHNGKGEQQRE